jgi:hypothetical protein
MSMNREIYMAKHSIGKPLDKGIYHSFYLPGSAVMFAGSLLVVQGQVTGVCPNSGHYLPTENNTLALLQALAMYGVPLEQVMVFDHDGERNSLAPEFMKVNGDWPALRQNRDDSFAVSTTMAWANLQHPYVKQWIMRHTPIKRVVAPPPISNAMPPPVQSVTVKTAPQVPREVSGAYTDSGAKFNGKEEGPDLNA